MMELLSPAGSMKSLVAAVQGGADAVYIGGKRFSARSAAENFTMDEIKSAIDYCHLRGVKLYVAMNTMCKDEELFSAVDFLYEVYNAGADAFILADLGLAAKIKQQIPIRLHASTQMTAHSPEDVAFLAGVGFDRIILARELSLQEIGRIAEQTDKQLECFVHGALCVCYSGQCLMSSLLGGRSGNRGSCAQPCRLLYSLLNDKNEKTAEGYLLSPKDLNALALLPDLIRAGVTSFKIEGRMKSPEYVYGVTHIYRKYLDLAMRGDFHKTPSEEDQQTLLQLFNRGGFTQGYFKAHRGQDMISVEKPKSWGTCVGRVTKINGRACQLACTTNLIPGDGIEIWNRKDNTSIGAYVTKDVRDGFYTLTLRDEETGKIETGNPVYRTFDKKLTDTLSAAMKKDVRKLPLKARCRATLGEELALTLTAGDIEVTSYGIKAEAAQKTAVTKEAAAERLRKMGSTPFALESIEMDWQDGLFVPIQSLNELRRDAAQQMEHAIVQAGKKDAPAKRFFLVEEKKPSRLKRLTVAVTTPEQFAIAVQNEYVSRIYVDYRIARELESQFPEAAPEIFIAMPRISHRPSAFDTSFQAIDGFLLRTYGQYNLLAAAGKKLAIDFHMNIANSSTLAFWQAKGCDAALSVELNLEEIAGLFTNAEKTEALVYGRVPIMVTRQCPKGNFATAQDTKQHCPMGQKSFTLQDRMHMSFPLESHCEDCYSLIYNSKTLFLPWQMEEVLQQDISLLRLHFTNESDAVTADVINGYGSAICGDGKVLMPTIPEYTKGHFYRGVQ